MCLKDIEIGSCVYIHSQNEIGIKTNQYEVYFTSFSILLPENEPCILIKLPDLKYGDIFKYNDIIGKFQNFTLTFPLVVSLFFNHEKNSNRTEGAFDSLELRFDPQNKNGIDYTFSSGFLKIKDQALTCDCGSPSCKYPNSFNCLLPYTQGKIRL